MPFIGFQLSSSENRNAKNIGNKYFHRHITSTQDIQIMHLRPTHQRHEALLKPCIFYQIYLPRAKLQRQPQPQVFKFRMYAGGIPSVIYYLLNFLYLLLPQYSYSILLTPRQLHCPQFHKQDDANLLLMWTYIHTQSFPGQLQVLLEPLYPWHYNALLHYCSVKPPIFIHLRMVDDATGHKKTLLS